tara:strand:+ start:344 stop:535 length:192 start_codon:yes stop_codon:yes gene_type:complete
MFKWLKECFELVNELEKRNAEAGIINVTHPFIGTYTYIDQEQYRKYVNDKKRTLSKDNKQSEE